MLENRFECWRGVLEKNVLKISRAKTGILKFSFKNKAWVNGMNHNVRLDGQLINKIKRLNYLGLIMQENEEIVEDVVNRIRCVWMKSQEVTRMLCNKKSVIKSKKEIL